MRSHLLLGGLFGFLFLHLITARAPTPQRVEIVDDAQPDDDDSDNEDNQQEGQQDNQQEGQQDQAGPRPPPNQEHKGHERVAGVHLGRPHEAKPQRLVVHDPLHWNGQGFFYAPDRLNLVLVACSMPGGHPTRKQCPSWDLEQMISDWKLVRHDADTKDIKASEVLTFSTQCFGKLERRFVDEFCQPDGVLFLPVKQAEFCVSWAKKYTFIAFRMGLSLAIPRLGLQLEHPEEFPREYMDSISREGQQEQEPVKHLEGLLSDDWKLTRERVNELKAKYQESGQVLVLTETQERTLVRKVHAHHRRQKRLTSLVSSQDQEENPFKASPPMPASVIANRVINFAWSPPTGVDPPSLDMQMKFIFAYWSWEAKTCVKWKNIPWASVTADDVQVFEQAGGSFARGREVHLRSTADSTVIEHELGHLLGMGHTQQRSERDEYVTYFPLRAAGSETQYETFAEATVRGAGPALGYDQLDVGLFDWTSVMLYGGGPGLQMEARDINSYSAFDRWANNYLYGSEYPRHFGPWGFTGATYGGTTVSDMDAHVVNLKFKCYARNGAGLYWDLGAAAGTYTVCPLGFTRSVVNDAQGNARPLCMPP